MGRHSPSAQGTRRLEREGDAMHVLRAIVPKGQSGCQCHHEGLDRRGDVRDLKGEQGFIRRKRILGVRGEERTSRQQEEHVQR